MRTESSVPRSDGDSASARPMDPPFACLLAYTLVVYIRPQEIVPALAGIPIVKMTSVAAAIVIALSYRPVVRSLALVPHDGFVLALWAVAAVSSLVNGSLSAAAVASASLFKVVFHYFLIRAAIRTPAQFTCFVHVILGCTFFLAVNGILQAHVGVGVGHVPLHEDGRIRGVGIFGDPNELAMALVLVVPFLLDDLLDVARGLYPRLLAAALLAPTLLALIYSRSRGGILALRIVLAGLIIRGIGAWRAALVVAVLLVPTFVGRLARSKAIDPFEESAQIRLHTWAIACRLFESHPLLGIGHGRFIEHSDFVAHNAFLHVLAELGVLGALCFVGLIYSLVRGAWDEPAANAPAVVVRWRGAILLSTVGVLTACAFLSQQYALVLYTLVAIGACSTELAPPRGGVPSRLIRSHDAIWIGALTLAAIVAGEIASALLAR